MITLPFLIDNLFKKAVVQQIEKHAEASVTLESSSIDFFPLRIKLNNLEIANKDNSMQNLIIAKKLELDIKLMPLLKKQILINKFSCTGINLNTPRKTAAKRIDKKAETKNKNKNKAKAKAKKENQTTFDFDIKATLKKRTDISSKSLNIDESKLQTPIILDRLESNLEQLNIQKEKINKSSASLKAISQRLKNINKNSLMQLKSDKEKLKEEINILKNKSLQAKQRLKSMQSDVKKLDKASKADIKYAKSIMRNISYENILTPTLSTYLNRIISLYKKYKRNSEDKLSKTISKKRLRRSGTTISFTGPSQKQAKFWIKQLTLNGNANYKIDGSFKHISSNQSLSKEPLTFYLYIKEKTQTCTLRGFHDTRTKNTQSLLHYNLNGFPVTAFNLSSSIPLSNSFLQLKGSLGVNNTSLNGKGILKLNKLYYKKTQIPFTVNMTFSGTINKPKPSFSLKNKKALQRILLKKQTNISTLTRIKNRKKDLLSKVTKQNSEINALIESTNQGTNAYKKDIENKITRLKKAQENRIKEKAQNEINKASKKLERKLEDKLKQALPF
eukprot:COSAG01_NODE_2503_length_7555_cov_3.547881_2_plen_559_part_00